MQIKMIIYLFTFDDGLKSQKIAAEMMHKLGLWGMFFISSLPLMEEKLLNVHKIHYLLGLEKFNHIYQMLKAFINNKNIEIKNLKSYSKAYFNQSNNDKIKDFKKYLNYILSFKEANEFLNSISRFKY